MSELKGNPGELRATVHVTRAATGKVETYELIGTADTPEDAAKLDALMTGRVHGASGAVVGPGAKVVI